MYSRESLESKTCCLELVVNMSSNSHTKEHRLAKPFVKTKHLLPQEKPVAVLSVSNLRFAMYML